MFVIDSAPVTASLEFVSKMREELFVGGRTAQILVRSASLYEYTMLKEN